VAEEAGDKGRLYTYLRALLFSVRARRQHWGLLHFPWKRHQRI